MTFYQVKKQYLEDPENPEMKFKPHEFNAKYYDALSGFFVNREKSEGYEDNSEYSYYQGVITGMRLVRQYLIHTLVMEKEEEVGF